MLHILKSIKSITDRNVLDVIPFDGSITLETESHSTFIIARGTVKTPSCTITGDVACSINEKSTIEGKGVAIRTYGVRMPEQKFCNFDAKTPGHLSYIDGCSNTNLIDPPRNGDPCLNYLYFPVGINQTFHTHPSVRIGFVLEGHGVATMNDREVDLKAGDVFVLDRHANHRFRTTTSMMSLAVFHPDSEDGPRDEHNPMKTRTYIQR